jgi:hypothetical protein
MIWNAWLQCVSLLLTGTHADESASVKTADTGLEKLAALGHQRGTLPVVPACAFRLMCGTEKCAPAQAINSGWVILAALTDGPGMASSASAPRS